MTMDVYLTDVVFPDDALGVVVLEPSFPDVDKSFRLHAWAAEFIELTYLGIPYRIPPNVDGKPTIKKASETGDLIH